MNFYFLQVRVVTVLALRDRFAFVESVVSKLCYLLKQNLLLRPVSQLIGAVLQLMGTVSQLQDLRKKSLKP
jgi:hypothetical protein